MKRTSPRRRASDRPGRTWAVLAILAFGLVGSLTVWSLLRTAGDHELAIEFEHRALERALAIERELGHAVDQIRLLAASFEIRGEPSRPEFDRLAGGLLEGSSSVHAFGFNRLVRGEDRAAHEAAMRASGALDYVITERGAQGALVPAAERERYVVVQRIAPIAGNESAVGFDVASEPVRRRALELASRTGSVAATGRLTLVQETEGQHSVLVAQPVFEVVAGQRGIVGYAVSVLRMGQLVEAALADLRPVGIRVELEDLDGTEGERSLYAHQSRLEFEAPNRESSRLSPAVHAFAFAGRQWRVVATPTGIWDTRGGSAPSIALIVGLLATAAFAGYLYRRNVLDQRLRHAIEQRDRAEQRLAGFGRMLDDSHEEIYVVDVESRRFVHVNRGAQLNLGYSMDELRSMGPFDLAPAEDHSRVLELLQPVFAGDSPRVVVNSEHQRKDGSRYGVEAHIDRSAFDGRPAIVVMVLDVTERQRVEERLRQSQRIEALGTLAGGIAHDINNLLTSIMGYTDLAASQALPGSSQRSQLDEVIRAAELARLVVRRILTFSRQGSMLREPLDLGALISETVQLVRPSLPASVTIEKNFPVAACFVRGDPTQLRQVLINLLTNAGHAMRERGGLLGVTLEPGGGAPDAAPVAAGSEFVDHARIEVRDTGCGIAPEVVERIFDPFFTTKGAGEGTGMGLAVVHGIITSHGGAITVDSVPGQGSTFQIWLPTTEARPGHSTADASPPDAGGRRIVLVDDEPSVLSVFGELLRGAGYRVDGFANGEDAIAHVRDDPSRVDLVVTDYRMPQMNGVELAERLASIAPRLSIVLISGYGELLAASDSALGPVCRVLSKPLRGDDLVRVISEVLSDDPPSQPTG